MISLPIYRLTSRLTHITYSGTGQDTILCDFVASTNVHVASNYTWRCNDESKPSAPPCNGNLTRWNGLLCENGCVTGIVLDGSSIFHNRRLYVERTVLLSGSLPATLGNLQLLRILKLPKNELSGVIPQSLGRLKNLQQLDLSYNRLTGSMPSSLASLSALRLLVLAYNSLVGTIPASYALLSRLAVLDLGYNSLTGTVPPGVCALGGSADVSFGSLYGCAPTPLPSKGDALI